MNRNLKNALQDANLTVEEFANIIQVDPKTVGRWISEASTPYPRHRATITKALALEETDLWPERTSSNGSETSPAEDEGDATRGWAYAIDDGAPDPLELIEGSPGDLDILHTELWFQIAGPTLKALLAHADAGHHIRLLTTNPVMRFAPLVKHEHVELRVDDWQLGYTMIRNGDALVFTFLLPGEIEQPPQLTQIQRRTDDGIFDRLAGHFEQRWTDAENQINNLAQLEQYRTNADEDDEDLDDDSRTQATTTDVSRPTTATVELAAPITDPSIRPTEARHWPRRPD